MKMLKKNEGPSSYKSWRQYFSNSLKWFNLILIRLSLREKSSNLPSRHSASVEAWMGLSMRWWKPRSNRPLEAGPMIK